MTVNGTIATREDAGTLAIRPGQQMWDDKQRAALSVLGIKNASNADLAVFMHYCQKTGLDPFSRQIYMICRREKQGDQWVDKQTIQVGIDGFRVIRDRIAARLGVTVEYEDTIWYDASGGKHEVWLSGEPPAACRVVVLKNGRRFPAVLRTAAYAATNKQGEMVAQWRTQSEHMIEKCCEAFALRRAFPNDLGGIYLEDEMPPLEQAPARQERVTVAEIIGSSEPADPTPASAATPAAGSGTTSQAAAGPAAPPASPPAAPASPRAPSLAKLTGLLKQIPLGDDVDLATFLSWITHRAMTHPGELTAAELRNVASMLDDALKTAGGDGEEAASQLWAQYRRIYPEQGGGGEGA